MTDTQPVPDPRANPDTRAHEQQDARKRMPTCHESHAATWPPTSPHHLSTQIRRYGAAVAKSTSAVGRNAKCERGVECLR